MALSKELKENFTIYIPTMHRTSQQTSYSRFSEDMKSISYLVTVEEDVKELEKNYPGVRCIVTPKEVKGISKVRQWIIDNAETRYVWMCDDDQNFYKRLDNDWHLKYVHDKEYFKDNLIEEMIEDTYKLISMQNTEYKNKYFGVGLSARQGNNRSYPNRYLENTRMFNTYALDTELFKKENIRFDEFRVMEDFNVTISFLTREYPNIILQDFCWGQSESNMAGGCSEYRTLELQKECAIALHKKFPDFVKVVVKEGKSWGEGLNNRHDVNVQWKKAFNSSQKKKERSLF
jgi:hypothetical protein